MFRRTLIVMLVSSPAALPAISQAYDIKPKTPDSAFAGKLLPDILGISADTTGESARAIFEASYKARSDGKNDIQQQKFGGTNVSYISALMFSAPAGAKAGEVLSANFSSPASANRVYFVTRNLTFAKDQQPSRAEMVKQVMDKYGQPTIVGDQHLYYVYRKGGIVSVGAQVQGAGGDRRPRQAARSEDGAEAQCQQHRPRQLRRRRETGPGKGQDAERAARRR